MYEENEGRGGFWGLRGVWKGFIFSCGVSGQLCMREMRLGAVFGGMEVLKGVYF